MSITPSSVKIDPRAQALLSVASNRVARSSIGTYLVASFTLAGLQFPLNWFLICRTAAIRLQLRNTRLFVALSCCCHSICLRAAPPRSVLIEISKHALPRKRTYRLSVLHHASIERLCPLLGYNYSMPTFCEGAGHRSQRHLARNEVY